ncbi:cupin domain-containing protein [Streptomyces sp. SD15]
MASTDPPLATDDRHGSACRGGIRRRKDASHVGNEQRLEPTIRTASLRGPLRTRGAWHRHLLGQPLHVTEGIGLVRARGGKLIVMRPGDTVYTPPGE